MPPRKEVDTLFEITSHCCTSWLSKTALAWKGIPARKIQRNYIFCYLSPVCRQELLTKVLSRHMNDIPSDNKMLLLELLGDDKTTSFDLTATGYQYIEEVFNIYRAFAFCDLTNIRRLGIVCDLSKRIDLQYKSDVNMLFYPHLTRMVHLTHVILHSLGDSKILATLGMNCENLEHLDISKSSVDDNALVNLYLSNAEPLPLLWEAQIQNFVTKLNSCCKTLKFLGLSETSVSCQSVVSLAQLMPNLESFGGHLDQCSMCAGLAMLYGGTPSTQYGDQCVLLEIFDLERNGLHRISLDNFATALHEKFDGSKKLNESGGPPGVRKSVPIQLKFTHLYDVALDGKIVSILDKACPNVSEFHIYSKSLPALTNFHHLNVLEVECDFGLDWPDNLYVYLEKRGSSLTSLTVTKPMHDFMPFSTVISACPNLEKLSMAIDLDCEDLALPKMTCANICVPRWEAFAKFCYSQPQLTELCVVLNRSDPYCDDIDLTDEVMDGIITSHSLANIEKLIFSKCQLGAKTVELCMTPCCPNLRVLGYVDRWSKLSREDVARLNDSIRAHNIDLILLSSTEKLGNECAFKDGIF